MALGAEARNKSARAILRPINGSTKPCVIRQLAGLNLANRGFRLVRYEGQTFAPARAWRVRVSSPEEKLRMILVKTFKGYEDKVAQLDADMNEWIQTNQVDVVTVRTALSHEAGGRSGMGDLIYTILYRADAPIL